MKALKTLGKKEAELIYKLYDKNNEIFTFREAEVLLNNKNDNEVAKLMHLMNSKNNISRIKRGKYIIVPQQLGVQKNYIGNKYVAAREIVTCKDYYIAYYSAMDYWGMLTQPLAKTFVVVTKRQQPPKNLRGQFRFIYMKAGKIWGINEERVHEFGKIRVADIERTIIDALDVPELCGGITEIAKGIWIRKKEIDYRKLADYVRRMNKPVIAKRLGYIMEILKIEKTEIINELKGYIHSRYDFFDPMLEKAGKAKNSWHLIDNVTPEQIKNIIWS